MPRKARIREDGAIYHVMARSISDIQLFRNSKDKFIFLDILNEAHKELGFTVTAFCLMDTHYHLIINSINTDISKIMKKINVTYACYYNRTSTTRRRGPVFADRYKSKIITDEKYYLISSLYIHNNPKDIPYYHNRLDTYPFSSLKYYINPRVNPYDFLDSSKLLSLLNKELPKAAKTYLRFFHNYSNHVDDTFDDIPKLDIIENDIESYLSSFEFENSYVYRSEKSLPFVNASIDKIIDAVCQHFKVNRENLLYTKNSRDISEYKAILVILLRSLADVTRKDLCKLFGNVSISSVYKLSKRGIKLFDTRYCRKTIFDKIIDLAS